LNDLKERGVIEKFTVKLDNSAVGEDFIVMMMVSTCRDLPKSFFADKRIKEVFGITGEYDLLMKLKFSDIGEFNKYIIDLRKNTAVVKTHTIVVTIVLKEEM
jgi:DNA-binding Lrp family transcriptional regulator